MASQPPAPIPVPAPPKARAKPRSKYTASSNPLFNVLLIINSARCVVCLVVMVWTVADGAEPMPTGKARLFEVCSHVFTLTAGAFIGLLGGRAAFPEPTKFDAPK